MKTLVENYTFNAALKTVTFNEYPSIKLENVLLITNVATNQMIYNFSNALLGGTVLSNVLTLDFNTTSMSSTDALQVWYDDGLTPSSNEVLDALYEISTRLEFLSAVRGVSADLRVSPLSTPNMSTLFNLVALGGWSANTEVKNWDNLTAINSNINNVQ
jgi:hypothetical protein